MNSSSGDPVVNYLYVSVGVGLIVLALLLFLPVAPQLFVARDSRDLTGGIAGMGLIAILICVGIVLIMREKTPPSLLRTFYFLFGGLAIFGGLATLVWGFYLMSSNQMPDYGVEYDDPADQFIYRFGPFGAPFVMVALGAEWIRRGLNVTAGTQSSPPTRRTKRSEVAQPKRKRRRPDGA